MTAFDPAQRDWVSRHHQAVLITLRRDGSPQSSNVAYHFDGSVLRISVTADRAKTRNVQRDGRVVLHVLGDSFWQYLAVQGTGAVGAVTESPGDAAGRELLEVYQGIAGSHPDHDQYFAAMVAERRAVLTVIPSRATGMIGT
ncbi:MAG: PPOX class F420-dependent oxidoreductase [Nakamurella sp.]